MFRSLEWVAGDERADPAARTLARRMHARLPSFDAAFTAATPLTRVRDIAHRNDVPEALKREIKHTIQAWSKGGWGRGRTGSKCRVPTRASCHDPTTPPHCGRLPQNKLHRNAGPEDLVATEAMLARLNADAASLSPSFVAEFRVFAAELREFFGASALDALCTSLGPSLDAPGQEAVARVLATKARVDGRERGGGRGHGTTPAPSSSSPPSPESAYAASPEDAELNAVMDALHAATTLRATLGRGLASGLRNDASDTALAMRQKWRLTDARLEEWAFVLLSRVVGMLDARGEQ